jgi:hypothetical protein
MRRTSVRPRTTIAGYLGTIGPSGRPSADASAGFGAPRGTPFASRSVARSLWASEALWSSTIRDPDWQVRWLHLCCWSQCGGLVVDGAPATDLQLTG